MRHYILYDSFGIAKVKFEYGMAIHIINTVHGHIEETTPRRENKMVFIIDSDSTYSFEYVKVFLRQGDKLIAEDGSF